MTASLEVVHPGPLSTLQDLGRPGLAEMGVGVSGAADRASLKLANRLVGNAENEAAIEVTFGGLVLLARSEVTVAVTGAACPVTVDDRGGAVNAALRMRAGARLCLGTPTSGLRNYVAVRGGAAVDPVLGSRSTDILSGLGPDPLSAGMPIPVGPAPETVSPVELAPVAAPAEGDVLLRVVAGPRDDWFDERAPAALLGEPYEVSADSDRIGMRLSGPVLRRAVGEELPSEGMVAGSVQVPPSGQPILFLTDHPVTGGYPVIAVVLSADVDRAAQARPGQRVRFRRR